MGRSPSRNKNLPTGMRARHRGLVTYYYFDTGAKPRKEIALGSNYILAVQEWARLSAENVAAGAIVTFRAVAETYVREVLPTKAEATRDLNKRELANLYKFFDDRNEPMESIQPTMIHQYLAWRVKWTVEAKRKQSTERVAAGKPPLKISGKEGQVPANREKALFSHIWNFARQSGLTKLANPCAGIPNFTESGRDVYVEDDILAIVIEHAEAPLRDAIELAYLTGQRPADVLKTSRADIKDGALLVKQNKTGKKVRFVIEGALDALIERAKARKVTSLRLISTEEGTPMTKYELRGAFDRARDAAVLAHPHREAEIREFQFRDLRAKAGTDTEELSGMAAAQDQLGHSTSTMTAHYVRHRRGKLIKPTKKG